MGSNTFGLLTPAQNDELKRNLVLDLRYDSRDKLLTTDNKQIQIFLQYFLDYGAFLQMRYFDY